MHTNRFLPPPVRLSQAIDEDFASSSGSACQITRRSFMKRTGGATVATLVAWNMATREAARAETAGNSGGSGNTWTPGQLVWYLFCKKDPSTPDMVFPASGMYQECLRDCDGAGAHDGEYRFRTFYYRKRTSYDGGERSAILEIRARGPVQCKRGADGNPAPDEEDLYASITIDSGRVICGMTSNNKPFEYFEKRMLLLDFTLWPNPGGSPAGLTCYGLDSGGLSIDQSGNVTYHPRQVVAKSDNNAFELGVFNKDYRVQSLGIILPHMLVQAVVGIGEEAKIKWKFGLSAEYRGVGAVTEMEWTNTVAVVSETMQWQIWKAYRVVQEDGSLGKIVPVGEAVPINEIDYIRPPQLERL